MTTWTDDELDQIGDADELRIAALRPDGTLRNPVTIWVVREDNELYVRSYKGAGALWYRGTQATHEGHVQAAGSTRTSPSSTSTAASTGRSTPPTGPSTAASAAATSTRWWRRRRRRPRSSWCRARSRAGVSSRPDVEDRPGGFDYGVERPAGRRRRRG